jgi:hypothetical protein
MNLYRLFGLTVASELTLPELNPAFGDAPADVTIRLGSVPAAPNLPQGLSVEGDTAILNIDEAGRYRIANGREIVVEPGPGMSGRNVRLYLLGSAFGAILYQRGLLPLHANAIVVGGKAIGFLGHPGAGKSTMAAWFHDRGWPLLADDVCVVTFAADGSVVAHAGIPRLRLWREALEASGRTTDGYELSFDDMDKYNVPTLGADAPDSAPLDHLYLLERAGEGAPAAIEALGGAAAVGVLSANSYRGQYARLMGKSGPHLMACAALAKAVPLFRAPRLWGLDRLEEEGRRLEDHARATIAARRG